MRSRGALVLAAFGPALFAIDCATERPVSAPPATRVDSSPPIVPVQSVATEPPPPAAPGTNEPALAATYGTRHALAIQNGQASYYGNSLAGHKTANGERYDPQAFTAAHRTLALGTVLRVRRADTGAVVYVRVTDRGPYGAARRIIDLSHAAAERLGMIRAGVAEVRLEVVAYGAPKKKKQRRRR